MAGDSPLLLDTCAVIWLMNDAPMSQAAVDRFDAAADAPQPLYVSPYSAQEIGMLVSRGRLPLAVSPLVWFRRLLGVEGIRLADMSPDILIQSSFLPGEPPRDPADRIIIATARELGLTIVTRDSLILDYAAKGHVNALAC